MSAIYKRELAALFNSMLGWIFLAVSTCFIGIYFMAYNLFGGQPYFSYALASSLFIFMALIPLLTMRSLSEERHSRTDQLLFTAPVSVGGVVLGKYFAMLTVLAAPTLLACLCPLVIKLNGTAFLAADYGALLAFFLLGAAELAVGELVSALTESQLIAALGTFGILLGLFLWDGLVSFLPVSAAGSLLGLIVLLGLLALLVQAFTGNWRITAAVLAAGGAALAVGYGVNSAAFAGLLPDVLGRFSPLAAFDSFAGDHVFDLRGLLLYLSSTALLLFLTGQVLQKRRCA